MVVEVFVEPNLPPIAERNHHVKGQDQGAVKGGNEGMMLKDNDVDVVSLSASTLQRRGHMARSQIGKHNA